MNCVHFVFMWVLALAFGVVILGQTAESGLITTFLGYDFTQNEWESVLTDIDSLTSNGSWVYSINTLGYSASTNILYQHVLTAHNKTYADTILKTFERLAPCRNEYNWMQECSNGYLHPDNEQIHYRWKPFDSRGGLVDFSADKLCSVMKGRSIMLVGDSMTTQFGLALMNAIWQDRLNGSCSTGVDYNYLHVPCSNTAFPDFDVHFVRNDRLSLTLFKMEQPGANFFEHPWFDKLDLLNISLLVLNRGAHYEDDDKLLSDVNATLSYLLQYFPRVSIIWRNSAYGHNDIGIKFKNAPLQFSLTLEEVEAEVKIASYNLCLAMHNFFHFIRD